MKHLSEFVIDYIDAKNPDIDYDYKFALQESRKNKNLLIDYTNNIITDEKYNEWRHLSETISKTEKTKIKNNLITETLHSYSANDFIKALMKVTNNFEGNDVKITSIENASLDKPTAIQVYIKFSDKTINFTNKKYLDKILDICKFYRYFITAHFENYLKYNFDVFAFEPFDTKEITKDIINNFDGKFYHLTNKNNVDKIKKYGLYVSSPNPQSTIENPVLFIKQKEIFTHNNLKKFYDEDTIRNSIRKTMNYRNFPDRTFIYYSKLEPKEAGITLCNMIKKQYNVHDFAVIEFSLKDHSNPIFKDSMMENTDNLYFGYSNIDIPKEMITNIFYL